VAAQPGGKAWVIYDADARRDAFRQALDKKIVPFQRDLTLLNLAFNKVKARSIEELADKLGVPPSALAGTIETYNAACQGTGEDPFGKQRKDMRPISRGPFYAMDASIDSKLLVLATMTVGGLRVDEATGRVLDRNGRAIEGLYAAGRSAIGICSQTYVSGLSFADCIFSGRRTARHAAAEMRSRARRPASKAEFE
jgi:3-oxo-5alpha-steroid 4-dehydrogenase